MVMHVIDGVITIFLVLLNGVEVTLTIFIEIFTIAFTLALTWLFCGSQSCSLLSTLGRGSVGIFLFSATFLGRSWTRIDISNRTVNRSERRGLDALSVFWDSGGLWLATWLLLSRLLSSILLVVLLISFVRRIIIRRVVFVFVGFCSFAGWFLLNR